MSQRQIPQKSIELARRYGTECIDRSDKKVVIDIDACDIAAEDGIDLYPYFTLTIVVTPDNVLKTVYMREK